jgi:hypothetical protein
VLPIIFSGQMVSAINDKRKTQTRRTVGLETFKRSETPGYDWTFRGRAPVRSIAGQRRYVSSGCWQDLTHAQLLALCPYGVAGDRLWVKETWQTTTTPEDRDVSKLAYAADWGGDKPGFAEDEWSWRPSIFMPSWASRITLEITEVRVQRLHDLSEEDARAEGLSWWSKDGELRKWGLSKRHVSGELDFIDPWAELARSHAEAFGRLWDSINAKRAPWESNPWVWAVTFQLVRKADEMGARGRKEAG